jgi:hypothetical protein
MVAGVLRVKLLQMKGFEALPRGSWALLPSSKRVPHPGAAEALGAGLSLAHSKL